MDKGFNMFNRTPRKAEKLEKLLEKMKDTPMNRQQIAKFMGVSMTTVSDDLTDLRFAKQVYICEYVRRPRKPFDVYYKAGRGPDVPKPPKLTQKDYNELSKQRADGEYKKPDIELVINQWARL